jgi:hypothetical protein
MAEFGSDATSVTTLSTAATVSGGVAKTSPVLEGMSNIFDAAGEYLTKKKEAKTVGTLAEFTNKQLAVADGVDQGRYNSKFARTMLRKNLMEAIEANPLLAKELVASQSSIVGLAGGADVVKEGTDQEQRQKARNDAMVASGFMPADTSDQDAKKYDVVMREAEEASRRHKMRMETLDEQLKINTLSSSERTRMEEEKKDVANRYIRDSSEATSLYLGTQFSNILKGDLSESEKQMAIEDLYNGWLSQTASTLGEAGTQEAQYMLKPIEALRDSYLKRATGEIGDAELKRQTDRAMATQKALALSDPAIAKLAVTSELFPQSGILAAIVGDEAVRRSVLNFLAADANPDAPAPNFYSNDLPTNKAGKAVGDAILNGLSSDDEVKKSAAQASLNKLFEGLEDNAGTIVRDPKKAKSVIDWMSSSSFYKAFKANPDAFEGIAGAKEVLERNYADEVWGLIDREFKNNKVQTYSKAKLGLKGGAFGDGTQEVTGGAKTENLPDGVAARSTSNGMEFYATSDKREFAEKASELNRTLKPIINNNLKAFAHINGRNDYGTYWDEVSEMMLGSTTSGGDAGDDLSLKDFQENLERLPSEGGIVGSVSDAGAGYTVVVLPDGSKERRTGTRAWRNNNPGNIEYGNFAKAQGAVGSDGRFAVFESYEDGRAAKEALLFESSSYKNKTLYNAISRYAPDFENDTNAYASSVANSIGVSTDVILSDLNPAQREKMLDAMERVEGFRVGKISKIE